MGDITGDSLELAMKTKADDAEFVVFCGVGFMGQSVKVLSPEKRVVMPKLACCAMASMIDSLQFNDSVKALNAAGIPNEVHTTYYIYKLRCWCKKLELVRWVDLFVHLQMRKKL